MNSTPDRHLNQTAAKKAMVLPGQLSDVIAETRHSHFYLCKDVFLDGNQRMTMDGDHRSAVPLNVADRLVHRNRADF
jgi:hypothetical protein